MKFLLANIVTSSLASALSAATVILELADGRPYIAAGSAAVVVLTGLAAVFSCTRMIIRTLGGKSEGKNEDVMAR